MQRVQLRAALESSPLVRMAALITLQPWAETRHRRERGIFATKP
jgi:hypothetical protein